VRGFSPDVSEHRSAKCGTCGKTVYANEVQKGIGMSFHKLCFKCTQCNSKIEPGSECDKGGKLVCKKCGSATEGFRGATSSNVASFVTGDVRPTGGSVKPSAASTTTTSSSGARAAFCGKCGTKAAPGAAFCASCGEKL
jgi:hypothetical protein